MDENENSIELGGNIELSGFGKIEPANLVVIKKVVGSYSRKFFEAIEKFEKLAVTLKTVHKREKSEKYEVHARVIAQGKTYVSEITDFNLFFALDKVLKKVESEMQH